MPIEGMTSAVPAVMINPAFIQVESERLRAKYRAPIHITSAPAAVIHS